MDIFATKTRLLKIGFTGTIEDLKFKKKNICQHKVDKEYIFA